ncbi:unnamed protein product [Amoebophrya sp. A25]|nr:unnamed protein product [Amoebophrya sp. A25]|eukprot:GSA25T00013701001.1
MTTCSSGVSAAKGKISEATLVGRANMIRPEDIFCTTEAQQKHLAAFQAGSKDWLSYQHEAEDESEIEACEDFLRHVLCLLVEQLVSRSSGGEIPGGTALTTENARDAIALLQHKMSRRGEQKRAAKGAEASTASHTPASSRVAEEEEGNGPVDEKREEQTVDVVVEDISALAMKDKVVAEMEAVDEASTSATTEHDTADAQQEEERQLALLARFLDEVSEKQWEDAVRNTRRHFQCAPPKSRMVKTLSQLVFDRVLPRGTAVERILKKKAVRSNSGVVVITVVTAPGKFSCPHDCYYCPDEPGQPRSYLSTEPAVQRANQNDFDPVKQFLDRAATLAKQGHEVDKVEIIVLGGTWSAYSKEYQDQFCRDLFYAANTFTNEDELRRGLSRASDLVGSTNHFQAASSGLRERLELAEEQRLNEASACKIIGLTLETRPDHISKAEVRRLRLLGCTRVQLGVQHTDDEILRKVNRGHSTKRSEKAVALLKTAGFKVDIHLMPDLPGSNPEKDWEMFRYVLNSDALQADHWKVYPCEVTPFTTIEQWHAQGLYVPYTDLEPQKMIHLLCNVKVNVHPWIRLNRVIRDIPEVSIIAGNQNTNLRQVLFERLAACGESCKCTRCREVRKYGEPLDKLFVRVRRYRSSGGWEFFLSVEGADRGLGGGAEKRSKNGNGKNKDGGKSNKITGDRNARATTSKGEEVMNETTSSAPQPKGAEDDDEQVFDLFGEGGDFVAAGAEQDTTVSTSPVEVETDPKRATLTSSPEAGKQMPSSNGTAGTSSSAQPSAKSSSTSFFSVATAVGSSVAHSVSGILTGAGRAVSSSTFFSNDASANASSSCTTTKTLLCDDTNSSKKDASSTNQNKGTEDHPAAAQRHQPSRGNHGNETRTTKQTKIRRALKGAPPPGSTQPSTVPFNLMTAADEDPYRFMTDFDPSTVLCVPVDKKMASRTEKPTEALQGEGTASSSASSSASTSTTTSTNIVDEGQAEAACSSTILDRFSTWVRQTVGYENEAATSTGNISAALKSSKQMKYNGNPYGFHQYSDARRYVLSKAQQPDYKNSSANAAPLSPLAVSGTGHADNFDDRDKEPTSCTLRSRDNGTLYGLLRLRLNDDPTAVKEMFPELINSALIRELHVYGEVRPVYRENDKENGVTLNDDPTVAPETSNAEDPPSSMSSTAEGLTKSSSGNMTHDNSISTEDSTVFRPPRSYYAGKKPAGGADGKQGSAQHGGIGKLLMCVAETIAERHRCEQIAVISGVGVRNYYRKLGYEQRGVGRYLIKPLMSEEEKNTSRPTTAGSMGTATSSSSNSKGSASVRPVFAVGDAEDDAFLSSLEIPFNNWQERGANAITPPSTGFRTHTKQSRAKESGSEDDNEQRQTRGLLHGEDESIFIKKEELARWIMLGSGVALASIVAHRALRARNN